jgi:hypothetical protein
LPTKPFGFAGSNRRLRGAFAAIITAEDVGAYKPAENHFRAIDRTLADLGLARTELLHVAQSLFHDHVPAKREHLPSVWINRRHNRPGWGATPEPSEQWAYDMEFTSMGAFADAADQAFALVIALERVLRARIADRDDQPPPETRPTFGQVPYRDTSERSGIVVSAGDAADIEHAAAGTGGTVQPRQGDAHDVEPGKAGGFGTSGTGHAGDSVPLPVAATEPAGPSPSFTAQDGSGATGGGFSRPSQAVMERIGPQRPWVDRDQLRRSPRLTGRQRPHPQRFQPGRHPSGTAAS